jgi:hypothetical protein
MARKITFDSGYLFIPSLNKITFNDPIQKERLLLVTNLSTNTVIYNFSDPNLRGTIVTTQEIQTYVTGGGEGVSTLTITTPTYTPIVGQIVSGYGLAAGTYVSSYNAGTNTITLNQAMTAAPQGVYSIFGTVITLNYNTAAMSAASILQIFVDEYAEKSRPDEVLLDPVSKSRVSTPQALIDTDFEYSTQPTKWETLQTIQNKPTFYFDSTTPIRLRDITVSGSTRNVILNADLPAPAGLTGATPTIATSATIAVISGTNTTFTSHLAPGSVIYTVSGVPVATVATVNTDTVVTTKNNPNGAFASQGYRFSGNITFNPTVSGLTSAPTACQAVGGIYSPFGNITALAGWPTISGFAAQLDFFRDVNPGDAIYTQTGLLVGTVSGVTSATALNLTTGAVNALTTSNYIVSQYTQGKPLFVIDSLDTNVDGNWVIDSACGVSGAIVGTSLQLPQFSYLKNAITTGAGSSSVFNSNLTYAYQGAFYTGSFIKNFAPTNAITTSGSTNAVVTVTTSGTHGFTVGNQIYLTGTTATTNAPNGAFTICAIPSQNSLQFIPNAIPTGTINIPGAGFIGLTQGLAPRPTGFVIHRPTDGGVSFSTGTNSNNVEIVRQTRRYFRYQSGKGIQFSTGTIIKTPIKVESLVADGTRVTVTTKIPHNLVPGVSVTIQGAVPNTFNGTFTIDNAGLSDKTFTYYNSTSAQTATGFPINLVVNSWYNATNRVGLFTRQNGLFLEFDGQNVYCTRRNATERLAGTVQVTNGSPVVTGVNTLFSSQLTTGDAIVIRGCVYKVLNIYSDTSLEISPEYRGATISSPSNTIVTKIIEYRIPQSQWNIDKADGTGPSGFKLDLNKIQMVYIDYSWYGAGAARFGFKNQRGEVIYVHRILNGNQKFEAYMRSGNLPARYESATNSLTTRLTASLGATDTGITVADNSQFPPSGTLLVDNEYITYTSKPNTTTFSGLTRGQVGIGGLIATSTTNSNVLTTASGISAIQAGMYIIGPNIANNQFIVGTQVSGSTNYVFMSDVASSSGTNTYQVVPMGTANVAHNITATAPKVAQFHSPRFAPTITHWGSSVIMDGRFDDDKSFVFTAGMNTPLSVPQNVGYGLLSVRIAPSVDNGRPGINLSDREIINTMQLTLRQMDITAQGQFLVRLFLNASVAGGQWIPAAGSSLAQVCYHTANTSVSSNIGEPIFSFYTNSSGGANFTLTSVDLSLVRDLGNSILGGGYNNFVRGSYYPDGPDILTVVATNIDTGATARSIAARLSWTEAQA